MKQMIGIPMGIDPSPFWAKLYLHSYEEEYMSSIISLKKVKARHLYCTKFFIDNLCAIDDSGEFGKSFLKIYPKGLELKIKYQGNQACFLNLDICDNNNIFLYKFFDKRDAFLFIIVRMPYIDSDIPQNIFYSAIKRKF